MLGEHTTNSRTCPSPPEEAHTFQAVSLHAKSPGPWQPLICFLSPVICLLCIFNVCGSIQYVAFGVWHNDFEVHPREPWSFQGLFSYNSKIKVQFIYSKKKITVLSIHFHEFWQMHTIREPLPLSRHKVNPSVPPSRIPSCILLSSPSNHWSIFSVPTVSTRVVSKTNLFPFWLPGFSGVSRSSAWLELEYLSVVCSQRPGISFLFVF